MRPFKPAIGQRGFTGHFTSPRGGRDLLTIDAATRQGRVLNQAAKTFDIWSFYGY
jgi:hypothetical protein